MILNQKSYNMPIASAMCTCRVLKSHYQFPRESNNRHIVTSVRYSVRIYKRIITMQYICSKRPLQTMAPHPFHHLPSFARSIHVLHLLWLSLTIILRRKIYRVYNNKMSAECRSRITGLRVHRAYIADLLNWSGWRVLCIRYALGHIVRNVNRKETPVP